MVRKILLLTVTRWQKESINIARLAVMECATDPQTARVLCFPLTGDVAVLLLQENTVLR